MRADRPLDVIFRTGTANRWELLAAMRGTGPSSIGGAACRAERDEKAAPSDMTALLNAGSLARVEYHRVIFPVAAVTDEFALRAA
jgi:predicted transcriptional regulator